MQLVFAFVFLAFEESRTFLSLTISFLSSKAENLKTHTFPSFWEGFSFDYAFKLRPSCLSTSRNKFWKKKISADAVAARTYEGICGFHPKRKSDLSIFSLSSKLVNFDR